MIFFSCGEISGDGYASGLLAALRSLGYEGEIAGMIGPRTAAGGGTPLWDSGALSIMGISGALGALPRLLKLKKVRLDGFEMFFGFRDKIGEKFRIKKFLAHNLYLYMAESTLLPELDTYCLSYRLSQKHLYITDHFFRLRRFYHIQVGAEAHAGLDVLFLPFG